MQIKPPAPFPGACKEALDKGVIRLYYKCILSRDITAIPEGASSATDNKALSAGG